jgi:thioredoxin-related protein
MKRSFKKILIAVVLLAMFSFMSVVWQPDIETAKRVAAEKHRIILLNFSGSDWCGPCIRMRKEIFDSKAFTDMADNSLVMLNADFPRNKKNQLSKEKQKANDLLAEKYNPEGKFPFTLLLDANGKVIKTWDALPAEDPTTFTSIVKKIADGSAN